MFMCVRVCDPKILDRRVSFSKIRIDRFGNNEVSENNSNNNNNKNADDAIKSGTGKCIFLLSCACGTIFIVC